MVAPARVRRWAWVAAAAIAGGFLAVTAFQGSRPEPGVARFEAAGPIADWPLPRIIAIEVGAGSRQHAFWRNAAGEWRADAGDGRAPLELSEKIEAALKLLHNSAPQRTDLRSDQLAEFGLAPPRLTVIMHAMDGAVRTIEFGGTNPLGLERYARTSGARDIMLLPSFVADAWEAVSGAR